jgi:hypothetical protein
LAVEVAHLKTFALEDHRPVFNEGVGHDVEFAVFRGLNDQRGVIPPLPESARHRALKGLATPDKTPIKSCSALAEVVLAKGIFKFVACSAGAEIIKGWRS